MCCSVRCRWSVRGLTRSNTTISPESPVQGRRPRLYVQVNTGEEPQKAGVIPPDADAFIAACRETYGLEPEGLMCIPPADEPPGPHFALLARIAARNGLAKLSMGMSGDFETAIAHGATLARRRTPSHARSTGKASRVRQDLRVPERPLHA